MTECVTDGTANVSLPAPQGGGQGNAMFRAHHLFAAALLAAPLQATAQIVTGAPDVAPVPGLVARARPQIDPSLWFADGDYPRAAIRAEQEGRVGLLLDTDAEGRVATCTVLASSGVDLLDRESCRIITRRVRFAPALSKDRKPAPDRWSASIDWKLPADITYDPNFNSVCYDCGLGIFTPAPERIPLPEPLGDPDLWLQPADYPPALLKRVGKIEVILKVAKSGMVRSCRVDVSSGARKWDREACTLLRRRARFQPEKQAGEKWRSPHWWHRYSWGPATAQ